MWLLRTDTAKLVYFAEPPPKYAILSHVWNIQEQLFHELLELHVTLPSNVNPRSKASSKVRDCCIYAESQGFEWLWIDTCCIDKRSTTELSEAISSMYRWYARATVCYVYLQDVPTEDYNVAGEDSSFRKSRWFTRGWTLQELIAPSVVHFLSMQWKLLGTKVLLSKLLADITGINVDVLTFARPVQSLSVSCRMSWASRRLTTRVEDEAYSLMGLFDVHIPTIYGEGRGAFRRLQEEIMRSSPDYSLFLWGRSHTFPSMGNRHLSNSRLRLSDYISPLETERDVPTRNIWDPTPISYSAHARNLLAESPADFEGTNHIKLRPAELLHHALREEQVFWESARLDRPDVPNVPLPDIQDLTHVPELSFTSIGIRAHLPVLDCGGTGVFLAIVAYGVHDYADDDPRCVVPVLVHRKPADVGKDGLLLSFSACPLPLLCIRSVLGIRDAGGDIGRKSVQWTSGLRMNTLQVSWARGSSAQCQCGSGRTYTSHDSYRP